MIRNLTAKRCGMVLIGRKLNGGGLICKSRSIFEAVLKRPNELVVEEPLQVEKCYDLAQAQLPWPITAPIYGEGMRSYGRLFSPTYDSSSTWLLNASQRATTDAVIFGKELINFLSKNDTKTLFLLLIGKSKQTIRVLLGESYKNNGQITSTILRTMRLPENYLWNNKAKVEVLDNLYLLLLKSKEISKLVGRKIKDEDIPLKLMMLSKQTGDATVSLIKTAKIPDRLLDKSNKLVSTVKVNSVKFYSRSKDLSKIQAFLTRTFGDFSLKLSKSYSQVLFKVGVLTKPEHLKAFQYIIQSSKIKSNPSNTYVNKFFDRSAKPGLDSLTSVVQTNKPEYTVTPSKQQFHSSAVRIYRPIKMTLYDNPLFWNVLKSETISDLKLVREISRLIPGPFKKIWRGIRDKSLPSWQATIASVLQKIQDSVIKKKK